MALDDSPRGAIFRLHLGSVPFEAVGDRLVHARYRIVPRGPAAIAASGGSPATPPSICLEPARDRAGGVLRSVRLWKENALTVRYEIRFAPVRLLEIVAGVAIAVAVVVAAIGSALECIWPLGLALILFAGPELAIAAARQSFEKELERAVDALRKPATTGSAAVDPTTIHFPSPSVRPPEHSGERDGGASL